jgi:parallel beta-helix repeat protein
MEPRLSKVILTALPATLLASCILLASCGSSGTKALTSPNSTAGGGISISISPGGATVASGQSTQFSATVQGSSNTGVAWFVGGIQGGNSSVGTISPSGVYTAPATQTALQETVTAQSLADSSKSANATIAITIHGQTGVSINISPGSATVSSGQSTQFNATVQGSSNTGVLWFVAGVQGGSASVGTISASGVYTAPVTNTAMQETVTAKSLADSSQSANATIQVTANVPGVVSISISPGSVSVPSGQSTQFNATVQGSSNTGVLWFVAGVQGGNASVGTISASGVYTAPVTNTAMQQTVTAHSAADFSKTANAFVSVNPPPPLSGRQFYISPNGSDSNDGSSGAPWHSFSHADRVVQPGDWVHVLPGSYNMDNEDGGRLKTTTGGTASARIHWVSDQKWGAKLRASIGGNNAVWWTLGDFVDIQGFDVSGFVALGIFNEGSNTRMIGNLVHDVSIGGCASLGGAGIEDGNWNASNDDVIGNWVYNIGDYNTTCAEVHGIYKANRGGHIYNNVVYRSQGWGIHLFHAATNVTIANNTIFNNAYGGIVIGGESGDFPGGSGVNDNTLVTNNIIYRNGLPSGAVGYGIEEYGDVGGNNHYINNLVSQNGPANWNLLHASPQGTIDANPGFVNYQDNGSGDYHLQSGSPAINAGTSQGAPSFDFSLGARPIGGAWDLGAYEFGATPGAYPMQ